MTITHAPEIRSILARDLSKNVIDRLSTAAAAIGAMPNPGKNPRSALMLKDAGDCIETAIQLLRAFQEGHS